MPKWLWAVIILFSGVIGSILYFAIGRDVPPAVDAPIDQPSVTTISRQDHIRRAIDALYAEET